MATALRAVATDPLVERFREYRDDPVLFVREIFGVDPTEQQKKLLKSVAVPGSQTAVKSGHGIGKSAALAWLVLWFLWTRTDAKVPCTAPSGHQLEDVLWSEVDLWRKRMPKQMADCTEVIQSRVTISGMGREHYAVARTARKEKPEALQGFHSRNLLFVIDEAAGVPDEVFALMRGALTTHQARVVMAGNPTLVSGYFYEAFHRNAHLWNRFTFSGEDSPLVTREFIQSIIDEYGEDSDEYRVRVSGEFPRQSLTQFIPIDLVSDAMSRHLDQTMFNFAPVVLGADVSYFGDDRSVLFLRQGLYSERLWVGRDIDTYDYATLIHRFAMERSADSVMVDVVGWGAGVVDALRRMMTRGTVVGVNAASASSRTEYANKRMEMWADMKKWLEDGGVIPPLEDLKADMITPEFGYHVGNGKMKLESKQFIKQVRKMNSPDNAEALALTFAYPVVKARGIGVTPAYVTGGRRRSMVNVLP